MTDAERFAHSFVSECQRFTEERMKTVRCHGCGLPLDSDVTEAEALAEERARDPEVTEVEFFCQVCLALQLAAHPDAPILGPDE